MGDFRIKYGSALGPQNNFFVRSDNVISSTDTTPDVTNGTLWFTNNASATTITDFELTNVSSSGSNAGLFEGKKITVVFLDGYTTIAASSQLKLTGTASTLFPAGSTLELIYHNSAWYELGRSINAITDVSKQTISGSGGYISDVRNVKTVVLAATAKTVYWSISNGQIGQALDIVWAGTSGIVGEVSMGGNIYLVGTASFTMAASGVYRAVCVDGTKWYWKMSAI